MTLRTVCDVGEYPVVQGKRLQPTSDILGAAKYKEGSGRCGWVSCVFGVEYLVYLEIYCCPIEKQEHQGKVGRIQIFLFS